jgi:hypothetical protein
MKLNNSVIALKDAIIALPDTFDTIDLAKHFANCWDECKLKCKDPIVGMRWNIWFTLPKHKRDAIIICSVGEKDYVGGYFQSVTDEHIYTLLKKTLTHNYISRLVVSATLTANRRG